MSEFQPIPVFVKESEISQELSQWNERKDYFQSIINKYIALHLAVPLLENDLVELVNTPKELLFKKITQTDEFAISGMKLDAEKAFDLIEKPTGSNELIAFIENSKKRENTQNWFYFRHANYFEIIDNVAEIKASEMERIRTGNTVYLKSQKEKDIFDLLTSLCDSLNSLHELKRIYHIDDKLFTDLLQTNPQTEIVSIREDFLSKL